MPGESAKVSWVSWLPNGEPSKAVLGRLVESDGARDAAEVEYYVCAADPQADLIETQQRRFRAQFHRRRRRRDSRSLDPGGDG
jgi:hypothetical protein